MEILGGCGSRGTDHDGYDRHRGGQIIGITITTIGAITDFAH